MSEIQNNKLINLDDLTVLRAVARARGFRAAAVQIGLSPSRVSDIVRRCEDRLGLRLFERSTRHVAPTDVLVALLHQAHGPLAELHDLIAGMADTDTAPKGILRIGAPVAAGPLFLTKLVAEFAAQYPSVSVDLRYDDAVVDPIAEGFDLVVRSNALLQQDHHALPIGPKIALCLVASPNYVEAHGRPKTIAQVADHDGICFRLRTEDRLAPWMFKNSKEGDAVAILPRVRATVDSLPDIIELARADLGLAMVYADAVKEELATGQLIEILPGQVPTQSRFSLAYLSKRHQPLKIAKFIELVRSGA